MHRKSRKRPVRPSDHPASTMPPPTKTIPAVSAEATPANPPPSTAKMSRLFKLICPVRARLCRPGSSGLVSASVARWRSACQFGQRLRQGFGRPGPATGAGRVHARVTAGPSRSGRRSTGARSRIAAICSRRWRRLVAPPPLTGPGSLTRLVGGWSGSGQRAPTSPHAQ